MKSIIVWGTGVVASSFLKEVINGEVIGYIESNKSKEIFQNRKVYSPEDIRKLSFDILVIASSFTEEIIKKCKALELDLRKIVYLRNFQQVVNLNKYRNLLEDVVTNKYYEELFNNNNVILNRMNYDLINESIIDSYKTESYKTDYCRFRTFELAADTICNMGIKGDVAEVGVNVGTFARIINSKFSDRTLYLFDTFESFDKTEYAKEVNNGNCSEDFIQEFKYTSVDIVLNNMPYPEKCVVKKGLFPATAQDLETSFAFVSIDVDFEQSIYDSIIYFYPRLNDGGYLFIHDYNNNFLFGVKRAVERYERVYGILKKVPIADNGGTLIVIK